MEYIEREAAKNAFPRAEADAFENCRYCTCLDSEQIGEILDAIPAADVVPVRHGRWSRVDYKPFGHDYICTLCKCKNDRASQYCPDCGALMDKDGDGDGV